MHMHGGVAEQSVLPPGRVGRSCGSHSLVRLGPSVGWPWFQPALICSSDHVLTPTTLGPGSGLLKTDETHKAATQRCQLVLTTTRAFVVRMVASDRHAGGNGKFGPVIAAVKRGSDGLSCGRSSTTAPRLDPLCYRSSWRASAPTWRRCGAGSFLIRSHLEDMDSAWPAGVESGTFCPLSA